MFILFCIFLQKEHNLKALTKILFKVIPSVKIFHSNQNLLRSYDVVNADSNTPSIHRSFQLFNFVNIILLLVLLVGHLVDSHHFHLEPVVFNEQTVQANSVVIAMIHQLVVSNLNHQLQYPVEPSYDICNVFVVFCMQMIRMKT